MSRISGLRAFLVCSATLLMGSIVSAEIKVAVINLQRAVLESEDIRSVSAAMEAKYKPRQAELEKLQRDIQSLQQQLQAGAGKLTPQAESELTAQGQKKQRDLTRLGEDLQGDVDRERNEVLGKSSQRMTEVVKKLAEEKGYDVVVDVSNTVYFKPALEITAEALAAYNKAYPSPK